MTRLLGVDLGERRIGLAVAEDDGGRAMPHATLRRGRSPADDAAAIARTIGELGIGELVVGMPFDASGGEGSQASLTREWIMAIAGYLEIPISLRDERLSSHLAETRLGPMKRGRSGGPPTRMQRERYRARVDREAAAIILQDELDARARGERPIRPRAGMPPGDPSMENPA